MWSLERITKRSGSGRIVVTVSKELAKPWRRKCPICTQGGWAGNIGSSSCGLLCFSSFRQRGFSGFYRRECENNTAGKSGVGGIPVMNSKRTTPAISSQSTRRWRRSRPACASSAGRNRCWWTAKNRIMRGMAASWPRASWAWKKCHYVNSWSDKHAAPGLSCRQQAGAGMRAGTMSC